MPGIRFKRHPRPPVREITPRRIKNAEKAIKKIIEKAGLFAAEVAAEMPTPLERVQKIDEGAIEGTLYRRQRDAENWLAARKLLRALPDQHRCLNAWNSCGQPGSATSFLTFVKGWPARRKDLDRPLTELEKMMKARLEVARLPLMATELTLEERFAAYELTLRGYCQRIYAGNVIGWKIATDS